MSDNKDARSRNIELVITAEIIDRAIPRNSGHCIISDAVQLAIPEALRVHTDLQTIRFSLPDSRKRYVYLTPRAAQHILIDFDQGVLPKPQQMKLRRPIQVVPMNRKKPSDPGPHGVSLPKDHHRAKRATVENSQGATRPAVDVTIENGDLPTRGALADPPAAPKLDKATNHRYGGQRRVFGLKLMRE